jgi:hypothetical protein
MPEPWRGVRLACGMPVDPFFDKMQLAIPLVDGELHFVASMASINMPTRAST